MIEQFTFEDFQQACNNQGLSGRAQVIDIYLAAINSYREKLNLLKPSLAFNKKNIEKLIENSKDWIVISDFLEDNIASYMTKPSENELTTYKNNGMILADQIKGEEENVFPEKKLLMQITKQDFGVHNKETIRVDFNLLDTKHGKLDQSAIDDNVSSIIDIMDKQSFLYKNLDVKKQTYKEDKLFAIISIDDTPYNICEKGLIWLLNTGWNYNFIKANQELINFYEENKLDYHFSYTISLDNLNFGIRQANNSVADIYSLIKTVKNRFNVLEVNKMEANDQGFFKKMFNSEKKIDKELLNVISTLLQQNQDLITTLSHKIDFLRKEIIINELKDKRVGD